MALQKNVFRKKSKNPDLSISTKERKALKRRMIAKYKKEVRLQRKLKRKGGESNGSS